MWAFLVIVLVVNLAPLTSLAPLSIPKFSLKPSSRGLKPRLKIPNLHLERFKIPSDLFKEIDYASKFKRIELPEFRNNIEFASKLKLNVESYRPNPRLSAANEKVLAEVNVLLNNLRAGKSDPNLVLLKLDPGKSAIPFIKKIKPRTSEDLMGPKRKPGEPEADLAGPKRESGKPEADLAGPKRGIGESEADLAGQKRGLGDSEAELAGPKRGPGEPEVDLIELKREPGQSGADLTGPKRELGKPESDLMGTKREPGKQEAEKLGFKRESETNLAGRKPDKSELEVKKSSSKVKSPKPELKPETQSKTKQVLKQIKKKLKKKMKKELKKCAKKMAKEVWKEYKDAENVTAVSDQPRYQKILKSALKKCVKKKSKEDLEGTTTWGVTEVPHYLSSTTGYKVASIFAGLLGFAAVFIVWVMVFMRRQQRKPAPAVPEEQFNFAENNNLESKV